MRNEETIVDMVCPDGVLEGQLIAVQSTDGATFEVVVPPGVAPGSTFQVVIPSDSGAAQDNPAQLSAQAVEERLKRLDPGDAEVLKSTLCCLYDFEELDEFIDEHCSSFADYSKDGEQQLSWTSLHAQYVAMVEERLHEHLREHSATGEQLYALLDQCRAADLRADGKESFASLCCLHTVALRELHQPDGCISKCEQYMSLKGPLDHISCSAPSTAETR